MCACVLLALIEPCCHMLGIPHPEGASQAAINYLLTSDS